MKPSYLCVNLDRFCLDLRFNVVPFLFRFRIVPTSRFDVPIEVLRQRFEDCSIYMSYSPKMEEGDVTMYLATAITSPTVFR